MNISNAALKLKLQGVKKAKAIEYLVSKLSLEGQAWTAHTLAEFENAWSNKKEPTQPLPQQFTTPAQVIRWIGENKVALYSMLTNRRVTADKIVAQLKAKTSLAV